MAVPAFRARTMFPETAGTSMTFSVPAGTLKGDALIVPLQIEALVTLAAPALWTPLAAQRQWTAEAVTVGGFVLPSWNEAEHGKEFTFTWGGASKPRLGFISSWSGCDPAKPVAAVSNATIKECTPASTVATIDAYSTPSNENLLLQLLWNNEGRQATPPAGYTEFADQTAGPAGNYKNAGVEKGEQPKVEITVAKQVTCTLGLALQPPQPAAGAAALPMVI